jgi:hypothetical protein
MHGGCQALGRFGGHHTRRTGYVAKLLLAKRAIQSGAIILCPVLKYFQDPIRIKAMTS